MIIPCLLYNNNKKIACPLFSSPFFLIPKQFYYITTLRPLCWVLEERHYEKLVPFLPHHQKLVGEFRPRIWDYYYELTEYKKNPNEEEIIRLSNLEIFSTKTGYDDLDYRIQMTKKKKDSL